MMRLLLLGVCALCLLHGGAAEPRYVLSFPALLKANVSEKLCVNLEDFGQPVDLSVVLDFNGVNTTIFAEDVVTFPFFQCNDFMVPDVESRTPVFVLFSATGSDFQVLDRKTAVIDKMENINLIQMDKPVYKSGQKVQFRLISLTSELLPVKEVYPVVYLQDPSGSRLAQWVNQESESGVLQMEFQLINDASPGYYTITAERQSGSSLSQGFSVEDYVSPRFDVILESENTLSVLDEVMSFNASVIYSYGKPVPGVVTARCCKSQNVYGRRKNCYKEQGEVCFNLTGELDSEGAFSGFFDLNTFNLGLLGSRMSFQLDVTVTEEGTGIQMTQSRYIWVTTQVANLRFRYEAMNQYYKRGIDFHVEVQLTDEKGDPIPNEVVELQVNNVIQDVTTDEKGTAVHAIDTSDFVEENFTIQASYKNPEQCFYREWDLNGPDYPTTEFMVQRFYSQSGSFLQVRRPLGELNCSETHPIALQYIVTPQGVGEEATEATFYFLVMSKASIVHSGQKTADLTVSRNGTLTIDLPVSADFAPSADLIVYSILNTEIITDTVSLDIEKCFKNQVSLTFLEEKTTPGSSVDLQLSAAPTSLCGLRVIDSSLLLINPYERFSASNVYYSIPYLRLFGYTFGDFNVEDPAPPCEDPNKTVFCRGRYYLPTSSPSERDSYINIKEIGLVFGTNSTMRKPVVCGKEEEPMFRAPMRELGTGGGFGGGGGVMASADSAAAVVTVRRNFSETFAWKLVSVNAEGQATVSETVPDTITEWQGDMFCVSETEGFGMTASPAKLTSLLPFFIELSLPRSITRGETMVMVASVSNYMESCAKVAVTLQSSSDFTADPQEKTQSTCICNGQRASYTWHVQANKIGEISFVASAVTSHIGATCDGPSDRSQPSRNDTVIQTVLVEPEGIKEEVTSSNLVCVQDANSEIPISIPPIENVVPDTPAGFVTALSDFFGLPLQNLDSLLLMPMGCGEQTVARLAPIPKVMEYLNNTGQLTAEIEEKCKNLMREGYYRMLRFRDPTGSYNAFERSSFQRSPRSGSSWLTVFAFKTIESLKNFIFIDENIQQQALIWLENSQKLESGCFVPEGEVFLTQEDKNGVAFTSYIAIALLQSNYSPGRTLLDGALSCLEAASITEQTTYIQALMVYAFTLAGNAEKRGALLTILREKAISEGGTVHWERENKPESDVPWFFHRPYAAAEVQITANILLGFLKDPNLSDADRNYVAEISLWLVRQQNSRGGFRSTQDTVVALEATAALGELFFTPNAQHAVRVNSANGEVAQFNLNQENRLLVQRQPLPAVPGEYSIAVNGRGCCLVQTTVGYNIPVPTENSAFSVSASTSSESCLNGVAYTFVFNVSVSYQGSRNASGMTIVDVKLLSGYQGDYMSLRKLVNDQLISKYEEKNNHIYLYLDSVSGETLHLSFKVQMGNRVLNVKTGSIYVYDYYEAAENGFASYSHPCAASG
ncbi:ovostatin-like [Spea bombifrons]|uniref:ovostatin-like n=1 Tax=Spea bombifrons TaxID=233779 RepID=UPI00234A19C0|nr:ovostatin-like [Spea bombifrons]